MMSIHAHRADDELIVLLKNNDEQAFTAIYERYWKKLFIIATNRLGRPEEAEEIVQDIFTTLWRRREAIVLTSTLSKYLAVSVKYRVIKTLDRYFNEKRYLNSLVAANREDDSTQEQLAFDELQDELAKYVQQLPEKCQLVFRLSRENGYTQKQIAAELNIAEKTVEAHLGKAFKTLRSKLAGFMMMLL